MMFLFVVVWFVIFVYFVDNWGKYGRRSVRVSANYLTPKSASRIPPEMAVPKTPARFGPMACMIRKTCGFSRLPTICDTRAAIGTEAIPADPIRGIDLSAADDVHDLCRHPTPEPVPKTKATNPKAIISSVLMVRN